MAKRVHRASDEHDEVVCLAPNSVGTLAKLEDELAPPRDGFRLGQRFALKPADQIEELLVLNADFNLHELIEDELVLELPMIARHASCPGATGVAEPDFGVAVAGRPNPFAVLARFKPDGGQGTK